MEQFINHIKKGYKTILLPAAIPSKIMYDLLKAVFPDYYNFPQRIRELAGLPYLLYTSDSFNTGPLYLAGKTLGNIIDAYIGYALLGPAGLALGGITFLTIVPSDFLRLLGATAKAMGFQEAGCRLEKLSNRLIDLYNILDKNIALLDPNIRKYAQETYTKIGECRHETLTDILNNLKDEYVRDFREFVNNVRNLRDIFLGKQLTT